MSIYKGNNLISGHQVLYSMTGQNTDGAMTQKAVSDITENTRFDGQWVYSSATIASNVTWNSSHGTKTYSLSNYLPDDGYNYEILFNGSCETGTTSANFINLYIGVNNVNEHTICRLCTARTRTASNNQSSGSSNIIIPSNMRQLVVYGATSSNANGVYSLFVEAYRRVGTNV